MSLDVYLTIKPCKHCGRADEVYRGNITHNLNKMADALGVYYHLWYPDKINIKKASQLIKPLQYALKMLKLKPEVFEEYEAENGWGTIAGLKRFMTEYLTACKKYKNADVSVWR